MTRLRQDSDCSNKNRKPDPTKHSPVTHFAAFVPDARCQMPDQFDNYFNHAALIDSD